MTAPRRFRAYTAAVVMALAIASTATAQYSGGSGTRDDPYQIATAADLIALGETPEDYDKHFILTADIDLDPNLPGRKVFDKAVIAPDNDLESDFQGTAFTGVLDGDGHWILHLTIQGGGYLGLFGQFSGAEIRSLGVVDVNVIGSGGCVGGLAGSTDWITVDQTVMDCYCTGLVQGTSSVGGLVGESFSALIRCYAAAAVSGDNNTIGGLVGGNRGSVLLSQCYSTGTVRGSKYVGGLVGYNQGHISQCYSTAVVSGKGDVGGLVGMDLLEGAAVTASFWDSQISGQDTSGGGTGLTTAQMHDVQTYLRAGWDFIGEIRNGVSQVWQMPEGGGYPVLAVLNGYTPPALQGTGTSDDPYLISSAMELGAVAYYDCRASYRLAASIDLSSVCWGTAVVPWFGGRFDGNGLTISHLTMITGANNVGLFGQLAPGAEVKGLGVVDVNVTGSGTCVGGLVGDNRGTVAECYSIGKITGNKLIGGLAGENLWGTIDDSYSAATVNGNLDVGGLAGGNLWSGTINHSYSTGGVSGNQNIGGLVGYSIGLVTQCYSTGVVSGNQYIGGLVGVNNGPVTQCRSTGTVSGTESVGGLVGANASGGVARMPGGSVLACYSTGLVTGELSVGGLLGSGWQGSAIGCFWDTQSSGQTTSAGGTGKTTAEMQTAKTFLDAGWDFVGETANGTEDIWWILEGKDYPRLWWELEEAAPQ